MSGRLELINGSTLALVLWILERRRVENLPVDDVGVAAVEVGGGERQDFQERRLTRQENNLYGLIGRLWDVRGQADDSTLVGVVSVGPSPCGPCGPDVRLSIVCAKHFALSLNPWKRLPIDHLTNLLRHPHAQTQSNSRATSFSADFRSQRRRGHSKLQCCTDTRSESESVRPCGRSVRTPPDISTPLGSGALALVRDCW